MTENPVPYPKVRAVRNELERHADEERAVRVSRFFQTGKGQYAEDDVFWGIPNPVVRRVAKGWSDLKMDEVEQLLKDPVHECRFAALLIWIRQYPKASPEGRQAIFDSYLAHLGYVNNWDLVDLSAPQLLGRPLFDKDRKVLYKLARRSHLWSQRAAVIATLYFIRKYQFADTLALAEVLSHHPHHLIHKATGWMLREVGNRSPDVLEEFLHGHIGSLPRTALRYAIEKLPPSRRAYYLSL